MRRVTPQPIIGNDLSASLLDRFREYSVSLNQCADHRLSEFVSVTGTYTAGQNDHVIECAPSGAMTVTLPAASVMRNKRIVIKRTNNTTHTVTIQSSSGNIDGAASVTLTTAHQSREVFSDGANWWLLDTGETAPTDPYFADVTLLMHCEGSDTSTTFTDSSSSPKTLTAEGSCQIDTAQNVFGSASALFDGNGDRVVVSNTSGLGFGTGDLTIEMFVRFSDTGTQRYFAALDITGASFLWFIRRSDNKIGLYIDGSEITSAATVTSGVWYHIAGTRSVLDCRLFLDGGLEAEKTVSSVADYGSSREMYIGGFTAGGSSSSQYHNGWIDEFRVTKGTARYTADFDVPTSAFPDS